MMRGLTRGQLAKATGVNLETIRYYETVKLMPPPPRTQGGRRIYDEALVRRLTFIRRSRELGFRLEDVRTLLALSAPQGSSCTEVKEIAAQHLADVQAKLADLARLEAMLKETIARCAADVAAPCPVLGMLDGMAVPMSRPAPRE